MIVAGDPAAARAWWEIAPDGTVTSEDIVREYLTRLALYDRHDVRGGDRSLDDAAVLAGRLDAVVDTAQGHVRAAHAEARAAEAPKIHAFREQVTSAIADRKSALRRESSDPAQRTSGASSWSATPACADPDGRHAREAGRTSRRQPQVEVLRVVCLIAGARSTTASGNIAVTTARTSCAVLAAGGSLVDNLMAQIAPCASASSAEGAAT